MKDFLDLEKLDPAKEIVSQPHELLGISASLAVLVKDIADKLEKNYPGWLWTINPDEWGGVIVIFSLRLSGEYGYRMKISAIQDDPERKLAMQAGGEILERFGIRRGRYARGLLANKMQDIRGNYIPDQTDKAQRDQKRDRDRIVTKAMEEGVIKFKTEDVQQEDGSTHRRLFMQIGGDEADAD